MKFHSEILKGRRIDIKGDVTDLLIEQRTRGELL
jgi:hypothetical protein